MKWIQGIPTLEQVRTHEQQHPAPVKPRYCPCCLHDINVSRLAPGLLTGRESYEKSENADACSYWLCIDPQGTLGPLPSLVRLKAHNNEILLANGHSFWQPLVETRWAARSRYLPVNGEGLPTDYKPE